MLDEKTTVTRLATHSHRLMDLLKSRAQSNNQSNLVDEINTLNIQLRKTVTECIGAYDWGADRLEMDKFDNIPVPGCRTIGLSGADSNMFVVTDRGLGGQSSAIHIPSAVGISWVSDTSRLSFVSGHLICRLMGPSVFVAPMHLDAIILQSLLGSDRHMHLLITDVDIVGYSSGISVDDITTEETYSYTAAHIRPWRLGKLIIKDGDKYTTDPEVLMDVGDSEASLIK